MPANPNVRPHESRLNVVPNKPPFKPTRTHIGLAVAGVLVLGFAWWNRKSETWVDVSATQMSLTVGASQQLVATLKHKLPFVPVTRSIGATIQLISFPTGVDVAPTTLVTTNESPEASLKVTGLKAGQEELIIAGSNRPTDEQSWHTVAVRVVVGAGPAQAQRQ
jgi:hypothetical protein